MAATSYSDYGLQPNGETILGAADGSPITLPSESLLLGGDYARAGSDLLISHADHGQVRIPDYFSHDDLPVLRLDNGALLTGDTVASLAGPLAPGQYAQAGGGSAGTPIGTVDTAGGTVTATRTDGTTVTLSDGDPVFQGDVVQTGTGSNLSIIFIDDTVFTLSADARMVLDELVYSPGGSDNSMVMNLVQGTFIFVTGQVAPNGDMRVETPTATMGIRGTTPVVTIDAGGAGKYSLARDPNGDIGSYQIFDKVSGALIGTINTVTEFVEIAAVGSPPIILPKTQADQSSEESQLQQAYSSSRQATGDQGNQNNGGENNNTPGGNEPNQTDAGGSESLDGPPAGGGTPGGGPGEPGANPETGTGEGLNLLNPGAPPPAPTSPPAPTTPPANPNPPANEQTTEPEQLGLDVPSITIETNEDEAITISGLQVDVPGGGDVQVQITASSTVTLASLSGLTFEAGDGTGDEFLIFTGSQSAVNAALNGLEYTPTPDSETGGLIFELTAGGETVTVDVPIEITPQPDAPIANAVSLNVDEGATVNGAFSVTDPDVGDTVTLNSFTFLSPDLGDLTIFIDGTFTFDTGSDFEELSEGEQTEVTFQYTAIDSTGLVSDPALVTFTVNGVNDPPVANDDVLKGTLPNLGSATIGYFDTDLGSGNPTQINSIQAGGHVAVNVSNVFDMTLADFEFYDVLVIQNPSDDTFGIADLNDLTVLHQAVENGLVVVFHDRKVDEAESVLPGSDGFNIVRDFVDDANIELLDDTHEIASGPGGIVSDTSLDNGNSSSHGFAIEGSLPVDADLILSTGTSGNIVTFSYGFGLGSVVYSTIPLDFYLAGNGSTDLNAAMEAYAANIIDYAAGLAPGALTDEDTPITIAAADILGNDTDIDGDTLSIASVTATSVQGAAVTLNPDGSISYDPTGSAALNALAEGEFATDSFTYTVSDGNGGTDIATVSFDVNGNEDAPVITGTTSGSVTEDSVFTATGALTATDADAADTPTFTAQADTAGTYGTFSLTAAGNWTYTLDNDAAQSLGDSDSITETFTAVATTADGESVSRDVTVTVNGADEPVTEVQEGFENGFSETWAFAGARIISPEDPIEGSHVLLLDTEAEDVAPVSTAAAILGIAVADLNALGNGETTEGSVLSSTEYIDGSGTIEFDYRFTTDDYVPYMDYSVFVLDGTIHELANVGDIDTVADIDSTGWQTFSIYVEEGGLYSVGFGVFDEGDTSVFSTLEIDNIRFTPDNLDPPEVFLSELSVDVEPPATHPGDTVYGFNSTEPGTAFDFASKQNPDVVIEDTSGNDTLDLSGYVTASAIDLTPGAFSSVNGQTDNIQIALGTDIENAIGGAGDDTLRGNDLANRLDGGIGLDTLTGGGGADVFVLSHTDAADIITDFDLSADRLDISALLDANFTPGELSDYLGAETNAQGDVSISVDQDGAGTAHGFEEVAILQGARSGGVIDFVFQDNGVQVTETFAA